MQEINVITVEDDSTCNARCNFFLGTDPTIGKVKLKDKEKNERGHKKYWKKTRETPEHES